MREAFLLVKKQNRAHFLNNVVFVVINYNVKRSTG